MNVVIDPGAALDALHRHITEQQAQITADADRIIQLRADKDNLVRAAQDHARQAQTWRDRAEEAKRELTDLRIEVARIRKEAADGELSDIRRVRGELVTKLAHHRGTSTMDGHGGYKNPVREGYDRGITDALAPLGLDLAEVAQEEARDAE